MIPITIHAEFVLARLAAGAAAVAVALVFLGAVVSSCAHRSTPAKPEGCQDVVRLVAIPPEHRETVAVDCPEPTFMDRWQLSPDGLLVVVCRCPAGVLEPLPVEADLPGGSR